MCLKKRPALAGRFLFGFELLGVEMPARLKAFLIHLLGSAAIALITLGLVFVVWYPAPLQAALGVTQIFLLLLAVDVTLGPLLTLIVYRKGKRTLFFDLSVIVLVQLVALGYGLWTVAEGRPAWIVYNSDRFDVVQVVDIDARRLDQVKPEYRKAPLTGPLWVGAVRPEDPELRQEIFFDSIAGGSDIAQRPETYRPLAEMEEAVKARAFPLSKLSDFNEATHVQQVLNGWPAAGAWVPLMARVRPMVVLLDKDHYRVLGIVDLKPWK